jgi:hypothetical protein
MRLWILVSIFIIIPRFALSQSKNETQLWVQIKSLYKINVNASIPNEIFINNFDKTLDILNHQILLDSVKIIYFFDTTCKPIYANKVRFNCPDTNCIIYETNNTEVSGLSIPFKSKSACYKFINLLSELKKSLNKGQN